MVTHYLKTAWRNLKRNKLFSIINISGLALGIAASLLIMLWIGDEYHMDNFHKHKNDIYQVYERTASDGKIEGSYSTQAMLAEQLKDKIPEIKYASSFEKCEPTGAASVFSNADKSVRKEGYFAMGDFFKIFSFPMVAGVASSALSRPNTIAISKQMAIYFYGTPQNALNKSIRLNSDQDLQITAVFDEVPRSSSLQFDYIRCWDDFLKENKWASNWGNTDPQTFVQLNSDAPVQNIAAKVKDFIYQFITKDKSLVMELGLQKFSDKYLHSNFKNGYPEGGRIEYIKIFAILAIFILIIACVNFMNLATAQTSRREKEVSMRKISGASRKSLILQFLTEALAYTVLAIIIALLIVFLILPLFNNLTGKHLVLPLNQSATWGFLLIFLFFITLLAGAYPAFYLSAFDPIKMVKGKGGKEGRILFIRKTLVVFQFMLSVLLVAATVVIYRQMNYIQTKNLGYDKDNLLYIPIEGSLNKEFMNFKAEALKIPGILNISKMRTSPTQIEHHVTDISWPGMPQNTTVPFADGVVGYDFVQTLHMQLKEGRDFSTAFGSDSSAFIINETAVKKMGWKRAIGNTLTWGRHQGTIIGVLKDFNFNSLHQQIEPLILRLDEHWSWGIILVRLQSNQTKVVLDQLKSLCKTINPAFPFTYQFSDEQFANLYKSETIVRQLSTCFATLAILISCLGLFGLSAFTAARRTKEIGIRKILGATVSNILVMLYGSYLQLIVIALMIAFPLSWFVMNSWLQNFAYKVDISIWTFVVAGGLTLLIAFITISHQALKAAHGNPVGSLKSD